MKKFTNLAFKLDYKVLLLWISLFPSHIYDINLYPEKKSGRIFNNMFNNMIMYLWAEYLCFPIIHIIAPSVMGPVGR